MKRSVSEQINHSEEKECEINELHQFRFVSQSILSQSVDVTQRVFCKALEGLEADMKSRS